MVWYCSDHRLAQFWADARRDNSETRKTESQNVNGAKEHQPFEHYCHCGKWGSFGVGASLKKGAPGIWYCAEHRPR
jgi:hypothetical protein